jgi:unsaturated rhamnogalacturonyl hydrolase
MRSFIKLILPVAFLIFGSGILQAQVTVGLDNWYNRETKNGKSFHYLWNDSAFSGYSQWGDMFVSKGAKLATLQQPTSASLKNIGVYIIVDPDTTKENPTPNYISDKDIKVIKSWVKKGGVLVLMGNDAPNCEFTHLNNLSTNFGIQFNHVSLKPVVNRVWEMAAFTSFTSHPVFEGVKKVYLKEVSSLKLSGQAKPVLTDNDAVIIAETSYGKGFVFVVGDPWIYNEYIDHALLPADFDNKKAAENLTNYLLSKAKK